ncbi:unnamed protein product [Toxocara canis]|uniref:Uncharacterized protein n=1 Tax=Toxocara canis TaxID=6265 RepID=A0A183TYE5_TOXCA|nr:unnamed protein product [Toxocara canis]
MAAVGGVDTTNGRDTRGAVVCDQRTQSTTRTHARTPLATTPMRITFKAYNRGAPFFCRCAMTRARVRIAFRCF